MIASYFQDIEHLLQTFPTIQTYTLNQKIHSRSQGYISGTIIFKNSTRLDFMEVKHIEIATKLKYRYHYMDANQTMIFRYDNAPHHNEVSTHPHHKHTPTGVQESQEPTLDDILFEIAQIEHRGKK
jgi:hypothetical protein